MNTVSMPKASATKTGVLTGGTAEALQGKAGDIVTFLHRDLFDRVGHVGDGDAQKSFGDLTRRANGAGRPRNFLGQHGELPGHDSAIQWLVAIRTEDRRKMRGLDFAHADIGVGDGQRSAAPIACRSGIGTRRIRADPHAGAVEMQDRAYHRQPRY